MLWIPRERRTSLADYELTGDNPKVRVADNSSVALLRRVPQNSLMDRGIVAAFNRLERNRWHSHLPDRRLY